MPTLIVSYPFRQKIMTKITGTGGPLDAASLALGLLLSGISAGTRTTLADCEGFEPDNTSFPGYARITPLAWGAQYRDGNDNVYRDAGEQTFLASADPPSPLSIVGAFWTDLTDVVIELFDEPQAITRKDDAVRYIPTFAYGQ
jgi:hypothetical protein